MNPEHPQHSTRVAPLLGLVSSGPLRVGDPQPPLDVGALYDTHFDFVWRTLRRMGVLAPSLDDAVQDVFLVVQRRFADFEGRSSEKTWLFGIVLRVASAYRKKRVRSASEVPESDVTLVGSSPDPYEAAREAEAAEVVQLLLDGLAEERRAVFVMIELEDLSPLEVSESLGVGINTVYSRLRLARRDFEAGLKRVKARDAMRLR